MSDMVKTALGMLSSGAGKAALDVGLSLIPPPFGAAVKVATTLAPSLYAAVQSFLGGEISKDELQAEWDAMLTRGEVADAAVAAGEAERQAQQGDAAS